MSSPMITSIPLLVVYVVASLSYTDGVHVGDHTYGAYENCGSSWVAPWYKLNACLPGSICQPPTGNPYTSQSSYCMPNIGDVSVQSCNALASNSAVENSGNNFLCPVGTQCRMGWIDCNTVDGGCCWPDVTITEAATMLDVNTYANAPDRTQYGATANTYDVCHVDLDCINKDEYCYGFTAGMTIGIGYADNYQPEGLNSFPAVGFCASIDLPSCVVPGGCPAGYHCGNNGAAAGMNVCFPINDVRVPQSYFEQVFLNAPATETPGVVSYAESYPATVVSYTSVPAQTYTGTVTLPCYCGGSSPPSPGMKICSDCSMVTPAEVMTSRPVILPCYCGGTSPPEVGMLQCDGCGAATLAVSSGAVGTVSYGSNSVVPGSIIPNTPSEPSTESYTVAPGSSYSSQSSVTQTPPAILQLTLPPVTTTVQPTIVNIVNATTPAIVTGVSVTPSPSPSTSVSTVTTKAQKSAATGASTANISTVTVLMLIALAY